MPMINPAVEQNICGTQNKLQQEHIQYHQKPNFMSNNILKVQENRPWAKKVVKFLHKVPYFKIYVIIASTINRFEETIALKSLGQRKYYVAVFVSNTQKTQQHLENFNSFALLGISKVDSRSLPTSKVAPFVTIVNGMQYLH